MSTEVFDKWAVNYQEYVLEELGEHGGQAYLDNLSSEDLHEIYGQTHGVYISTLALIMKRGDIVDKYDGGEF